MPLIRRLIWDSCNVAHIAQHQVTPEEAEEVCHGDHIVPAGHSGRIMLIGPTKVGRILAVILEGAAEDVYYVATARSADPKECHIAIYMKKEMNK